MQLLRSWESYWSLRKLCFAAIQARWQMSVSHGACQTELQPWQQKLFPQHAGAQGGRRTCRRTAQTRLPSWGSTATLHCTRRPRTARRVRAST